MKLPVYQLLQWSIKVQGTLLQFIKINTEIDSSFIKFQQIIAYVKPGMKTALNCHVSILIVKLFVSLLKVCGMVLR